MEQQRIKLNAETEFRFSVPVDSLVSIVLMNGTAEMFGTELMINKDYVFRTNTNGAIFTWQGCSLVVCGNCQFHIAKCTPMVIFANIHASIEQMRQNAEEKGTRGPTVLIAGPKSVGKSTLCRMLLNYAVRQGRKPVYVDLDIGQGNISVPGTIGALVVSNTADIEEGFAQNSPLVYHYGHKSPGQNLTLYNAEVTAMSKFIHTRLASNPSCNVSGKIINTCGWVRDDGYRALTHAIMAMEADIVIVLGQEKFYIQLSRHLPSFVTVTYLPQFTGPVECEYSTRYLARDKRMNEYFYGSKSQLHPHTFKVKFSDVKIYKIEAPMGQATDGRKENEKDLLLEPIFINNSLKNHVLSISFSKTEDNVMHTHIAGFVCVMNVNINNQCMTVLSPQPPPLPEGILLYSEIKLHDFHT